MVAHLGGAACANVFGDSNPVGASRPCLATEREGFLKTRIFLRRPASRVYTSSVREDRILPAVDALLTRAIAHRRCHLNPIDLTIFGASLRLLHGSKKAFILYHSKRIIKVSRKIVATYFFGRPETVLKVLQRGVKGISPTTSALRRTSRAHSFCHFRPCHTSRACHIVRDEFLESGILSQFKFISNSHHSYLFFRPLSNFLPSFLIALLLQLLLRQLH